MIQSVEPGRQTVLWRNLMGLAFAVVVGATPTAAAAICGEGIIDGEPGCCACDCDANFIVTVDEIVSAVNAALGSSSVEICIALDCDGSGTTTVDEIITCVNNALNGCPASNGNVKECDDGGLCVGGANAGTACTSEADCVGEGACFGGIYDLHACAGDEHCAGTRCRKCRPYGGDGCAANCTFETDNVCPLVPFMPPEFVTQPSFGSRFESVSPFLSLIVPLTGRQVLTTGKVVDGSAPVVIKAAGFNLNAAEVSTIACSCIRGVEARTCGGTLFDRGGAASKNCTMGFPGAETCPAEKACAAVHGPGNTASGFVSCGDPGVDIDLVQDCTGAGAPFDPQITITERSGMTAADRGSALLALTTAMGTVIGGCTGTSPDYGPDGVFCTDDDSSAGRGTPTSILLTTGAASSSLLTDVEADQIIEPLRTSGSPFTCNADLSIAVGGTDLAGGSVSCSGPTVADSAATVNFVCE